MTFAINIFETLVVINSQRLLLGLGLGAGLGLRPSKREREALFLCSSVPEVIKHTQNKITPTAREFRGSGKPVIRVNQSDGQSIPLLIAFSNRHTT